MNKELEIWRFAAKKLKQNEQIVLLVVAESSGSSPGRKGFKMVVAQDGLCGSIGGGVMEVNLAGQARSLLTAPPASVDASNSLIRHQVHQKNSPDQSGMICSGKQTVIFFKLNPSHLETLREITGALEKNAQKILRITRGEFNLRALKKKEHPDSWTQNKDSTEFTYEEKLGHTNKLFIVGGGHCALALSELMSKMDFYISLFDDRPGLNTLDKNKFVHRQNIVESYENIAEFIPGGEDHFVVVMTLGYKSDELVIRKLLGREFKYFGVLGSKAKMKTLLKELEKDEFTRAQLEKIRTPIGLPINSRTPEEIAVSIAAEIIAVKNSAK